MVPTVAAADLGIVTRPNSMLSQAITGHGAFSKYLHRIGKRTTP